MNYLESKQKKQLVGIFIGLFFVYLGLGIWGFMAFETVAQRIFLILATTILFILTYGFIRLSMRLQRKRILLAEEIEEHHRAEEALKELATSLESKVAQRTEILTLARERLEADLAARKALESELEQTIDELRVANSELEEFAYIASHDLQEPLRKIQAFGNRLETKFGDVLPEQGHDYLHRMRNAASRMSVLINDILVLSRVTTRAQPFEEIALSDVIDDVLSDMEILIEEEGAEIEIGDLPTLRGDPVQMGQLFQNLISNAIKFRRGEPPRVRINAHRDDQDPEFFQITVEDNGIGLDTKYAERIFTVFQRLHGRQAYEGSGIGLAICRKIITRHGGDIVVESTPGQGSTLIITLPENPQTTGDENPAGNNARKKRKRRNGANRSLPSPMP